MKYQLSQLNQNGVPHLLDQITSMKHWEDKRRSILTDWLDYVGLLPERGAVNEELISEVKLEDHVRRHLRYATVTGDWVTAYLLLPIESKNDASARFPAILALHPTNEGGKDDIGTSEGRNNRQYGLELVRRGYVVLIPDTITAGERIYTEPFQTAPFYEQYPGWTAVGKMLIDHMHGVDLLSNMPQVNADKIGAIGHSLGGYNAFFLAGIDRRIQALVSSCGFATFAGDPRPNRWGQRDWFSHLPRLTEDIGAGYVPFEFNEIAALAAPTPAFYWSGKKDKIFPNWQEITEGMTDVKELYTFLEAADSFIYLLGAEEHDFPQYIRQSAYDFLDRWLK